MSSINYKPRLGFPESTEQLHNRFKEMEDKLARSRAEANDRLQAELARRELFGSSLLAALCGQGIDLSSKPIVARMPYAPRALTGKSQTHANEHSPMLKRSRISPSTHNSFEDLEDDVGAF